MGYSQLKIPKICEYCGKPREPEQFVFEDLPDPLWISRPLKLWIEAAGIKKNITFHVARHSYATLQLYGQQDVGTYQRKNHSNICESGG